MQEGWRKTKLPIHHDIYKESLRAYNLDLKSARETFFSDIIKTNTNNAKTLFAMLDYHPIQAKVT